MTETAIVTLTEPQRLEKDARDLVVRAIEHHVHNVESFESAGSWLTQIRHFTKRVHEVFDPIVDAAHKAHRVAVEQRKALLAPAEGAERVLKERMAAYQQEQERRLREAEEAARREQERLEAEARAEAERLEAEARRAAEDTALEAALQAEAAGDHAGAAQALEQPVFVPPVAPRPVFAPPVTVTVPQAQGVSFRDNWSATVVDFKALVQAVASGAQPLTLLLPNEVTLNQMARALKAHMQVPGVRAENRRGAQVRV